MLVVLMLTAVYMTCFAVFWVLMLTVVYMVVVVVFVASMLAVFTLVAGVVDGAVVDGRVCGWRVVRGECDGVVRGGVEVVWLVGWPPWGVDWAVPVSLLCQPGAGVLPA